MVNSIYDRKGSDMIYLILSWLCYITKTILKGLYRLFRSTGWMHGIPGVKAFFSAVAVMVIGPEVHHRQHSVMLLDPERGDCRKTTQRFSRAIEVNELDEYINFKALKMRKNSTCEELTRELQAYCCFVSINWKQSFSDNVGKKCMCFANLIIKVAMPLSISHWPLIQLPS